MLAASPFDFFRSSKSLLRSESCFSTASLSDFSWSTFCFSRPISLEFSSRILSMVSFSIPRASRKSRFMFSPYCLAFLSRVASAAAP
nr:MAG TPA: hypothetical protein [Caudoviricetes sp.]